MSQVARQTHQNVGNGFLLLLLNNIVDDKVRGPYVLDAFADVGSLNFRRKF